MDLSVQKITNRSGDKCSTQNIIPSEHEECVIFYQWAQLNPLLKEFLIKNCNEGKRTYFTGKRLKAIGMRKGLPDYFLPLPNATKKGLWIEMKRVDGRNKTKDFDQLLWIKKLLSIGHHATFCYGADDAIQITKDYLANKI